MTTTPERIEAIGARLAAATPGPWTRFGRNSCKPDEDDWFLGHDIEGPPEAERGQFERVGDAELIAHAPDDLKFLLAERQRLLCRVAYLEGWKEHAEQHHTPRETSS